jgi:beta-phosphoglucomutase-like phosphatase (HAD superfamily)
LFVITEETIGAHTDGVVGVVSDAIRGGAKGMLCLSMDVDLLKPLMGAATSFSCAMGPAVPFLTEHLVNLPECEDESRPVLYACENDHGMIEKLQFALRTKIEAIPCMVDRICADLTVSDDALTVHVTAEGHEGSIVMLATPSEGEDGEPLPLMGDHVQSPENEADSKYLYRKKLLTVNGMHTVIAFRTLCSFAASQRSFQPPEKCPSMPLLSDETITAEQRHEIWSWGVAQLLVLMWEHGVTTMKRVHRKETDEELVEFLLDTLRTTLDRFFSIEDSTSRVLGGGVSLRYEGRLLPTATTVSSEIFQTGWNEGCPQELLLAGAGLEFTELKQTLQNLVDEARPFAAVDKRARAMEALENAMKEEQAAVQIRETQIRTTAASDIAVIFDFDGTLGDTESPAMEVAFWELAPYFPNVSAEDLTPIRMKEFIRLNAGKAFELMFDKVETERAAVGLPSIEEIREKYTEDFDIIQVVNANRAGLGLEPLEMCRENHATLLEKQKDEILLALRALAKPNDGVVKALNFLKISGFKYCVSTTSPKPRVPVCIETARLQEFFPDDKIHSGQSDFDPPKYKPEPDVYLKAAAAEGISVDSCIAVEDSVSGVGSAANANIGLIVGYVGGSHVARDLEDTQAFELLEGTKSLNGRGADIVIRDMEDLPAIVNSFLNLKLDHPELCKAGSFDFSEIKNSLRDKHWEADSEGLDKRNMRELDETQELDEA